MNYNLNSLQVAELRDTVELYLWRWELGEKYNDEKMKVESIEALKILLAGPQLKEQYLKPQTLRRIYKIKTWQKHPELYKRDKELGLVNLEQMKR